MPFPAIGDYGPYDDWDETQAYAADDVVYYGGYLYRAMTSTSAGDNPRTATYSCTLSNTSGLPYGSTLTKTMRKWRLFDLPFSYYQAMLRGIPPKAFSTYGESSSFPDEVRTISAVGFALDGEIATECSPAGYDLFAGLDVTYAVNSLEGVDNITLLYSFSAVPIDKVDQLLGGQTYLDPTTNYSAIFWQPNTVGTGSQGPAWGDDCQGMMFASMQTFSRDYGILESYSLGPPVTSVTNDVTTVAFQDNWLAAVDPMAPSGIPLNTDPDFPTDT